jgi:hypothetical protein
VVPVQGMKRHGPVRVARCGGRTTVERSRVRQSHRMKDVGEESRGGPMRCVARSDVHA